MNKFVNGWIGEEGIGVEITLFENGVIQFEYDGGDYQKERISMPVEELKRVIKKLKRKMTESEGEDERKNTKI